MANRRATTTVAIEGEKEYKQALQSLASGSKTLNSEMKLLQAQYKGNTESTEFLTAKSDLLSRQLDQQQKITAETRTMVQKASEAYEQAAAKMADAADQDADAQLRAAEAVRKADMQLQKYMTALNNSEAEEYELQHAIDETSEALERSETQTETASESMKGLGDVAGDLTQKLGISLPDGAKNALNGMGSLSTGTVAAMAAAAAAVTALIKTVQQLQQTTIEAAARADDILTRSTQMNISARQYQALQYASPFVDVDVDTLAGSLSKLTKAMGDAQNGSASMQKAFSDLGVEITNADGSLRSSYDVWLDTMDALSGMTNETERDAAAMDLLGKSATNLSTIYREGTDALREYTAEAENSYIMSDEQLAALGRVDDAVQHLTLTQEANKNMIASQWAPTAEAALKSVDELLQAAGRALEKSGIIKGFGELIQLATWLIEPITNLLNIAGSSDSSLGVLYDGIHGITQAMALLADATNFTIGLLQTLTIVGAPAGLQRMGTAMGYGASSGNYSFSQRLNGTANVWEAKRNGYVGNGGADMSGYGYDSATGQYYDLKTGNYIYSHNAAGTANWRGGLTWVGESGPELAALPAGTRIYSAQESQQLAGGDTFYISIDATSVKEFNDIVRIAQSARVRNRMR